MSKDQGAEEATTPISEGRDLQAQGTHSKSWRGMWAQDRRGGQQWEVKPDIHEKEAKVPSLDDFSEVSK